MRKTKIICTMGPSTEKGDTLKQLVLAGMNVARMNFSHGDFEEHGGRLKKLKEIRKETGRPVAALLDTKGPESRLVEFEKGKIELPLKKGDVVGNIIIKNGNNVVGKVDAVVNENIKTIGFFKLLLNNFKDIVSGNLI